MVFLSNLKEKNRHFVTNKIISYVYKKKVPDIITKTNLILEFCQKKRKKNLILELQVGLIQYYSMVLSNNLRPHMRSITSTSFCLCYWYLSTVHVLGLLKSIIPSISSTTKFNSMACF